MNTPVWVVKDVKANEDYTLYITFADGSEKIFDARPLLDKETNAKLRNPAFFMQAKADGCSVMWDDDTDIAPEYLYEYGVPVKA